MKIFKKISLALSAAVLLVGCEATELDLLDNPNNLNPSTADATFLLNDVQLAFNGILGGFRNDTDNIMRHVNMFSTYNGAADDLTLTGEFTAAYNMFLNIDAIEGLNDATEEGELGLPYHVGVGQVLEAYTYVTLVDYLGKVPFSQANQPDEFPEPVADPGDVIYAAMFDKLDEAIQNLNQPDGTALATDLYYDGDLSKWISLANTLKIKMYVQQRLVAAGASTSGINSVLATNRIIDNNDEDFQFQYSTEQELVEGRHPYFTNGYLAAGAGQYMSNNLYDIMDVAGSNPDPRTRYYFYRQVGNDPSGSDLPCAGNPAYDYCYVGGFYWGRDHADDEGIPNDGFKRTTYGVYPGGGAFDDDAFMQARANENTLEGAGIQPLMLASYTHFMLAEAALTLGTSGNAANYLEQGVRLSLNKVQDFGASLASGTGFGMTQADKDAYVAGVMAEYNSANNNGKLAVIMREYYIANFGNSIEAYTGYKRTGLPNLQAPIFPAGQFPRSYKYPASEININSNIQQNQPTDRVFWDNNPAGFID